jgi:hypothetical protein
MAGFGLRGEYYHSKNVWLRDRDAHLTLTTAHAQNVVHYNYLISEIRRLRNFNS